MRLRNDRRNGRQLLKLKQVQSLLANPYICAQMWDRGICRINNERGRQVDES